MTSEALWQLSNAVAVGFLIGYGVWAVRVLWRVDGMMTAYVGLSVITMAMTCANKALEFFV